MEALPIFLKLDNQPIVIIGGNEAAFAKINLLLKARAKVKVIAKAITKPILDLERNGEIKHQSAPWEESDIANSRLVICTLEDYKEKQEVYRVAKRLKIPVNTVDEPELCDFVFPSIVDRSPLVVAISTSGHSPTLARLIRARLEAMLPQNYGRLALLLGGFRDKTKHLYESAIERRKFWDKIFAGPIVDTFLKGQETEAAQMLSDAVEKPMENITACGGVCLVGAGPGDPDLLTVRALRHIQNADAIVYDRLVAPELLDYARRDAELIYVGKKVDQHTVPQEGINQILVDLAKQGKMTVRLKGGDPFIFGRGGEEIEELVKEGIDFQVIPGVTAAAGCGAYSGIPLTHRDFAQSVTFITGHLKEGELELNWKSLVQPKQTVVFYMGLKNLKTLSAKLIEHGMSPDMPAAAVSRGTTKHHKVVTGTISNLYEKTQKEEFEPPTLIFVGEVVKLREKLEWFKSGNQSKLPHL